MMLEVNDIGVVIPVYNEEKNIASLLSRLREMGIQDIRVVDGGSSDKTVRVAKHFKATVILSSQGRAIQMNAGAKASNKKILWFIHADTLPPQQGAKKLAQSCFFSSRARCLDTNLQLSTLLLRRLPYGSPSTKLATSAT